MAVVDAVQSRTGHRSRRLAVSSMGGPGARPRHGEGDKISRASCFCDRSIWPLPADTLVGLVGLTLVGLTGFEPATT